jgi:hypothetical protein
MKGRAAKRHKLAIKRKRADGIIRQHGIDESAGGDRMEVRTKKFVTSHWGCNCCMCMNPRMLWKGKNTSSMTLSELTHPDME